MAAARRGVRLQAGVARTRRDELGCLRALRRGRSALLARGCQRSFPARVRLPVTPRRKQFGYRLARAIYAFRLLFPIQVIRADDLGRAMVDVAVRERGTSRGHFRTATSAIVE
jgi:hypothetical protein